MNFVATGVLAHAADGLAAALAHDVGGVDVSVAVMAVHGSTAQQRSQLRGYSQGLSGATVPAYADWAMDTRNEIREFLTSRRARLTPEETGLPSYGARRVPGLRREEVAILAGVSVDYYTRLERGDMRGASESVLEALARALQLDDAERAHLFDLARAAKSTSAPRRRRAPRQRVRPSVQHFLDGITGAAAVVHNARLDNLAANKLGRALYSDLFTLARGPAPVNSARYVFLEPSARDFYVDWNRAAGDVVAILRYAAGRDPYDRDLSDLVGELSTRSEAFRTRWAAHNVRLHETGVKDYHHSVVGELTLTYNRLELAADPGLAITVWTAEPGSKSAEALNLLGSWAATLDQANLARTSSSV
jgi:transcriptional regulator with XRE-family HTH domain